MTAQTAHIATVFTRSSARLPMVAAVVLAALLYLLFLPMGWTDDTPLPWDEAGHFVDAYALSEGVREGDGAGIRRVLLGPDQYPPGHSVVLGLWMWIFGATVSASLTLGFVIYAATALLLARVHLVAALLFLVSPFFGGIAPALMVEPLADLLLVAALVCFPNSRAHSMRCVVKFVAFGLLVLATVLTKYNVGLPLIAAALITAASMRDRRILIATSITSAAVVLGWVAFLHAQTDGWEMFREFAVNRSNSAGAGLLARLDWYALTFRRDLLTHPLIGAILVGVIGVGLVERFARRALDARGGALRPRSLACPLRAGCPRPS
jgi:hypothetical protein